MERGPALVQGEDSESDEEINTEHLTETSLVHARGTPPKRDGGRPGIVEGEGSETDEEDGEEGQSGLGPTLTEHTDGAMLRVPSAGSRDMSSQGSSPRNSRRSSGDSTAVPPAS